MLVAVEHAPNNNRGRLTGGERVECPPLLRPDKPAAPPEEEEEEGAAGGIGAGTVMRWADADGFALAAVDGPLGGAVASGRVLAMTPLPSAAAAAAAPPDAAMRFALQRTRVSLPWEPPTG